MLPLRHIRIRDSENHLKRLYALFILSVHTNFILSIPTSSRHLSLKSVIECLLRVSSHLALG
jgi:hypothetical protein